MPSPIRPSLRLDLRAPPGRRLRPGRPLAGRRPPMGANAVAIAWEAFRGPAGHGLTGWEVTCAAAEVQPEPPDRNRGASRRGRWPEGYPPLRTTVWPPRWSSSAARAHAVVVSVLTPAEVLISARRLAGARPHLAAVAGIVHQEDLWQLCRVELTGVDVRIDGWDIRDRWFGVVVGATPRLGELRRGETIPWRAIAAQIAPRGRRGSH